MLKKSFLPTFSAIVCITLFSNAAVSETLSDSMSKAIAAHPAIAAGKAAKDATGKEVWEQRASFFPTLSVNAKAGYQYLNNDTTRGNTGGIGAETTVGDGSVVFSQPLFAGFGNVNRYEAAKGRRYVAGHELGAVNDEIALTALRAHLNLMRTRELLDLAAIYYGNIEKRHNNIALMVGEGAADISEQMQAAEIMMSAKNTRLGYEEAYQQAEADYMEAVGNVPPSELTFGASIWEDKIPTNLDVAIARALQVNPSVLGAQGQVNVAQKEAEVFKSEFYPRIDAELSYSERDQDDKVSGESKDAAAMLRMSWNFSYGGAQFARVARGKSLKAEAVAQKDQALRDVAHQVRKRFTSMKIVDEQFAALAQREETMQGILDTFLSQFEAGLQSNLQLISAHSRLFDAQAKRTDAYYRRLLSRFELLSQMGILRTAFGLESEMPEKTAAADTPVAPPVSTEEMAGETAWGVPAERQEKTPVKDFFSGMGKIVNPDGY